MGGGVYEWTVGGVGIGYPCDLWNSANVDTSSSGEGWGSLTTRRVDGWERKGTRPGEEIILTMRRKKLPDGSSAEKKKKNLRRHNVVD